MFIHRHSRHQPRSRGFTLMELMLVLGLLVIVGAILIPSVVAPLKTQKLRKSADLMRAAWSRARVNAMRTGLIHVFQYQPQTGSYLVKPWAAEQDALEGNPLETPLGDQPGSTPYQAYANGEQLPDDVIFVEGNAETDLRWQMHMADEGSENQTEGAVTPPIVFYPDGTTSNAQIWLSSTDRKYSISVSMRGMTGVSRAGPLLSAEEMQ